MTTILGINAYHADSSACILHDGHLVAAVEEERLRRIKHWAGFPSEAIKYCLAEANTGIDSVDCIAINRDPAAQRWRKIAFMLRRRPAASFVLERIRHAKRWTSIDTELAHHFPETNIADRIRYVEHHLAHLASAFYAGPFDEAVAVSIDGSGDFSTAAWGVGRGRQIEIHGRIPFPDSLGIFYEALTQYLGFENYGDEYKVMGLAPYGEPKYVDILRQLVLLRPDGTFRLDLRYFQHHREQRIFEWRGGAPLSSQLFSAALERLLGPRRHADHPLEQRHKDIARSVQWMYEEAFFNLLNRLHERYRLPNLVLAGGCAFNSVANGKVYAATPFRRCYVQAAAGDAGGAIGAAYRVWHGLDGANRRFPMTHAYWGPHFSDTEIAHRVAAGIKGDTTGIGIRQVDNEDEYCGAVASAISEGQVVGWFQGRMEWGPRALGNRSILCDPRRADMKDILNLKIKRRESFRPFAPSILRDCVRDWFETDDDVPFMMKVFQIRQERRAQIPAVTHVDGSGRLQTVSSEANPKYYRLIERFRDRTGVPIVLNTSFNENEPIVCRPEEAIDCFRRTRMDVLAIGKLLVTRQDARS